MDKKTVAAGCVLALLPLTGWAQTPQPQATATPAQAPYSYFASLKGGMSQISNSDQLVISETNKQEADTTRSEGFGGLDIGIFSPDGRSRLYYSYEHHRSESEFANDLSFETVANLHLLSGDYMFRNGQDIRPFVGLHFGYAWVESESDLHGGFDVSGTVFGVQAGVNWTVMDQFAMELGVRHSRLPADIKTWDGVDSNGNAVRFESQQNGVSSMYAAVSYRF
ncbi:hypothetical protein VV869_20190 [Photobacterium sp. MCCC 1A19761]|uniref:outer membrane protein n=1 Tax=Photobacterium sp. MCCC 1A19761 TaxID=3115000 RepID=UPI00307EF11F